MQQKSMIEVEMKSIEVQLKALVEVEKKSITQVELEFSIEVASPDDEGPNHDVDILTLINKDLIFEKSSVMTRTTIEN